MTAKRNRDRGRVQFTDVILAFVTLVTFGAVAPWVYSAVGLATNELDPMSSILLQLALPLLVISMMVGVGVSATTGG